MELNIKSQIRRLSNRINLFTVINEAVVNSIQAGSTEIKLVFYRADSQKDLLEKKEKITGFDIIDNGRGFTKENRKSFSQYGSEFKIDLGCKGIGRLCFLKVFDSVNIESSLVKNKEKIGVNFTDAFKKSDFVITLDTLITANSTIIKFRNLKKNYEKDLEVSQIKENLYNHIIPLLYLNKGTKVIISLVDYKEQKEEVIRTEDLPTFETKDFTIKEFESADKKEIPFTIHYSFSNSGKTVLNDFYCSNKRTVCRFKDKDLKVTPIDKVKTTILLTSEYLDNSANDERDDFEINPRTTNLFYPLSWEQINNFLRREIRSIFYKKYPHLEEKNKQVSKSIREENLHLASYLEDIDSVGGIIDSESIIERAENLYSKDKQSFKKKVKDQTIGEDEIIKKASELAGKELIEYVMTRDKIISQFEKHNNDNAKLEKLIHNLILQKGVDGSDFSPIPLTDNNMWLIDDKFMGYCYAASDKTIKIAVKNAGGKSDSILRPDLSIFFRNENDTHNAVIVELKPLGVDADTKYKGLRELREYADNFRQQKNLDAVWYYLITKIDDEFEKELKNDDYQLLFSAKEKMYFRYYKEMSLYLYVLSADTLIADARARNKTFIDIVKKVNGL